MHGQCLEWPITQQRSAAALLYPFRSHSAAVLKGEKGRRPIRPTIQGSRPAKVWRFQAVMELDGPGGPQ